MFRYSSLGTIIPRIFSYPRTYSFRGLFYHVFAAYQSSIFNYFQHAIKAFKRILIYIDNFAIIPSAYIGTGTGPQIFLF